MTELLLVKYGGNAMRSDELKRRIVAQIVQLRENGQQVVVVHGGGPFIGEMLDMAGIAPDAGGEDYNINADMFAGHLAGALKADRYLVLTDVDGVLTDINDPSSLIGDISVAELQNMMGTVIVGGMIPKLESCRVALEKGAAEARIINGMKPEQLRIAASGQACGTRIFTQLQRT